MLPCVTVVVEGGVVGREGGPAPKWGGASPLRSAGGEVGGRVGNYLARFSFTSVIEVANAVDTRDEFVALFGCETH